MVMISRLLIIISFLFAAEAHADIYKYVTEDGVECFTDSPSHKGAVLVLKEYAPLKRYSKKSAVSKQRIPSYTKKNVTTARKVNVDTSEISGKLPVQGRITSLVGMRIDPIDGIPRFHNGVDISVPQGTPVRPVAEGTVVYSGTRSGYGNIVIIEHPDGMTTIYAHHSVNFATVGQQVGTDTVIALSGSTGRSTGPHLHFEAWKDGENITTAFTGNADGSHIHASSHEAPRSQSRVRTAILPDGSILFTNYPISHE